jgi:site-specific DNA-methyltransferase (adenine-specific)
MGIGKIGDRANSFKSNSIEYSTPISIVEPLIKEFSIEIDVCASSLNHKLPDYWTKEDNALTKDWLGNCWMNPPFDRNLSKWVKKAHDEAYKNGGTKVCLIPVRSNTKWWAEYILKSEIRFINGEVNFNEEPRGLWMGMCIVIFGDKAKIGTFSIIDYRCMKK